VNDHPRGLCPICKEDGIKFGGPLHGLAGHLEKDHSVKALIYAIANEACLQQEEPAPQTCVAHNDTNCNLCTLNPADCAEPNGACDEYRVDGMHSDECPNRITTYEDAVKRLHRINGGPQFGIVYKFGREGDPCPECKGFNGRHNSVIDERDWGTDCRRCSYDPAKPVRD
jgi:hypothetical protein